MSTSKTKNTTRCDDRNSSMKNESAVDVCNEDRMDAMTMVVVRSLWRDISYEERYVSHQTLCMVNIYVLTL